MRLIEQNRQASPESPAKRQPDPKEEEAIPLPADPQIQEQIQEEIPNQPQPQNVVISEGSHGEIEANELCEQITNHMPEQFPW